ncbi:hypothetical protein QOZ80_8AG0638300 [Eleusine coracana subsp. coracana]|nr:hypothetical protein QOZ80_8AG0638300 [Eleusine coracana subsp. coracana]
MMNKMNNASMLLVAMVVMIASTTEAVRVRGGPVVKTKTFLSPPFFLRAGGVSDKYFDDVDFPRGHVALKSFNGDLVDESGAPVPLHEAYLHHWLVFPYYAAKANKSDHLPGPTNSGPCTDTLGHYFGLGAETRHTNTWVPDPYGIEAGDPARAPAGYEERWVIDVHAIDTRGAADKEACTECTCTAYNVTAETPAYLGGVDCCYDGTRCKVKDAYLNNGPRKLFLRYNVSWIEWSDAVVPVRIYVLDATDKALLEGSTKPACKVEYQVEKCSAADRARNNCVDVMATKEMVPYGGDLVYAAAHQHRGGIGSTLHGQDGRLLCKSMPIYGTGHEAGNETGYIVGMTSCYPEPGTAKISDGELLTIVSNYSNERQHTGVMSHYYILVADQKKTLNKPALCFSFPYSWCLPTWLWSNQM